MSPMGAASGEGDVVDPMRRVEERWRRRREQAGAPRRTVWRASTRADARLVVALGVALVVVGLASSSGAQQAGRAAPMGSLLAVAGGVALVVFAARRMRDGRPRMAPGWYDDPDDPARLRYHDGAGWTGRTADKT